MPLGVWATTPDGRQRKTVNCPCCGGPGGSTRFSRQIPRGNCDCSGCICCPGVCIWATDWHKTWLEDSPIYSTGPGANAIQSAYSATLDPDGNLPDWMYLGDVAGTESSCNIAGLLDENCSETVYRIIEGQATYDWTELTVNYYVTVAFEYYTQQVTVLWNCSGEPGFYSFLSYDGAFIELIDSDYPGGITMGFGGFTTGLFSYGFDLAFFENTYTTDSSEIDTTFCNFTMPFTGRNLPPITIYPIYE